MNRIIPRIGSIIVSITVLLFAIYMLIPFDFGSYFVCMFLPIGYILMAVGFLNESDPKRKVTSITGVVFAGIYATLIFIVYFAQLTIVRTGQLGEEASLILDFKKGGLLFNYDLLGYGIMALSTFFVGLSIDAKTKADKWLKNMLMIHGIFFLGCLIMPMTGIFKSMAGGSSSMGGVVALEIWCLYFLPIGVLSTIHFWEKKKPLN